MAASKSGKAGAADFDMTKFFDFEKMMGDMRVPGFDATSLMEAQRKNIEALVQANKVAAEGFQALAQRQQDILREHVEQMQGLMRDAVSADTPEANAGRQAELMKIAFEKALLNMRELAELASKSQSEAFEIVNRRVMDSMEEFRQLADQSKGKGKG